MTRKNGIATTKRRYLLANCLYSLLDVSTGLRIPNDMWEFESGPSWEGENDEATGWGVVGEFLDAKGSEKSGWVDVGSAGVFSPSERAGSSASEAPDLLNLEVRLSSFAVLWVLNGRPETPDVCVT